MIAEQIYVHIPIYFEIIYLNSFTKVVLLSSLRSRTMVPLWTHDLTGNLGIVLLSVIEYLTYLQTEGGQHLPTVPQLQSDDIVLE